MDSSDVVKLLSSSSSTNRLTRPLVAECRDIFQAFQQVQLCHCYREANHAVDLLAKIGSSQCEDFVYYVTPPFSLLDVLVFDCASDNTLNVSVNCKTAVSFDTRSLADLLPDNYLSINAKFINLHLFWQPVGLGKIAKLINAGKIDSSELITMKTLKDTGAIGKQIKDGVRLMGRGAEQIKWPIHLEVSRVTVRAKEAVEAAGGSVRRVYYNKLGFRALLKPEWFEKKGRLLPKAARPPPKQRDKVDSVGRLPAPTKPIPFSVDEKEAASSSSA
nr:uncharacterized protein LOC111995064 [Quercus suber]